MVARKMNNDTFIIDEGEYSGKMKLHLSSPADEVLFKKIRMTPGVTLAFRESFKEDLHDFNFTKHDTPEGAMDALEIGLRKLLLGFLQPV